MKLLERIKQSPLITGFVDTMLGSGSSRIILALTTLIVARNLTQSDFGQYSFVRGTLEMILCICALNFSSLSTKFTSEARHSDKALHQLGLLFVFSCLVCCILGVLLISLPEKILIHIFVNSKIVTIFRWFGILLPLFFLAPLIEGAFRGLLKFKFIGIAQTVTATLFLVAAYIGVLLNGLNGALYAIVFYYVIRSIIYIIPLLRRDDLAIIANRFRGFLKEKSAIVRIVLPMFILSFVEAPTFWLAQLALTNASGFESVASMTVIMQIRNVILIIPGYFIGTFMAFACNLNAKKEYSIYYNKFDRIIKLLFIISVLALVTLFICGKWVLMIFGSEYVNSISAYFFGILCIPLYMYMSLTRLHMVIYNRQTVLLFLSILWNAVWLGLFIATVYWTNYDALLSFFICQVIALGIYCLIISLIYNKDKKFNHEA